MSDPLDGEPFVVLRDAEPRERRAHVDGESSSDSAPSDISNRSIVVRRKQAGDAIRKPAKREREPGLLIKEKLPLEAKNTLKGVEKASTDEESGERTSNIRSDVGDHGSRGPAGGVLRLGNVRAPGSLVIDSKLTGGGNLYIGNRQSAADAAWFKEADVRAVLNITAEVQCFFDSTRKRAKAGLLHPIQYMRVRVTDSMDQHLVDGPKNSWEVILDFAETQLIKEKRNMLVHCAEGRSRSATITTALLMVLQNMSLRDAYSLLQQRHRRADVSRNLGFQLQLQQFEKKTRGTTTLNFLGSKSDRRSRASRQTETTLIKASALSALPGTDESAAVQTTRNLRSSSDHSRTINSGKNSREKPVEQEGRSKQTAVIPAARSIARESDDGQRNHSTAVKQEKAPSDAPTRGWFANDRYQTAHRSQVLANSADEKEFRQTKDHRSGKIHARGDIPSGIPASPSAPTKLAVKGEPTDRIKSTDLVRRSPRLPPSSTGLAELADELHEQTSADDVPLTPNAFLP